MCKLVLGFSHVDVRKERTEIVSLEVSPIHGDDATMVVLVTMVREKTREMINVVDGGSER